MKRFIEIDVAGSEWSTGGEGHSDPGWYTSKLDEAVSRFDAEARLLQALHDSELGDDAYHTVRLRFDALAEKGWGTDE